LTSKEIAKYANEIRKMSVMCQCGRRVNIHKGKKSGICSWCGRKVLNKKEQFKLDFMKFIGSGKENV
jgi:hypothetical protein